MTQAAAWLHDIGYATGLVSSGLHPLGGARYLTVLVRDLLWYADMTVGPDGQSMNFEERMKDVRARYRADHAVIRTVNVGMVDRRGAVWRAEEWIERVGLTGHV